MFASQPTPKAKPAGTRWTLQQSGAAILTAGLLVGGARWAAGRYRDRILGSVPELRTPLEAILEWGWIVAAVVVVIGVVVLVLASKRSGPQGGKLDRPTQIASNALRARPEQLRVRTKWSGWGRSRHPRRIVISYQPGTVSDREVDDLRKALDGAWQADYTVSWAKQRDRIVASEKAGDEPAGEGLDHGLEAAATDPLDRARQISVAHFGPDVEVTAAAVDQAGEPTEIAIHYPPNPRTSSELLRLRVGEEITRRLPGGMHAWITDWNLQADTLHIHRRTPLPTYLLHPVIESDPSWPTGGLVLPYAVDGAGAAIGWDLNASTPHALVIGPTGAGKTVVLRSIATEAPRRGCEVWIGDPKRIEMKGLKGWPGITRIATRIPDIIAMIEDAHSLMMARYDAIETNQLMGGDLTPLVMILDEHLIFVAGANRHWKATKEKGQTGSAHPVLDLLQDLIVLARSSRIHLCIGVQRPDAELFKAGGRDSVRHRVSLGELSPEGALMLWNNAHTGTRVDMSIRGRATGRDSSGQPAEIQTWWTPDPDPYLLARNPDALTAEELTTLARLRDLADQNQQQRPEDDLTELRRLDQAEGGHTVQDEHNVPSDVKTAVRARDLEAGMTILVDLDGSDVRATVDAIGEIEDDDTLPIELTTSDGRPEVLQIDSGDAVMVLQLTA